ncbi:hypothetical protein [Streptomyces jeddahensis]|uniref:Uncharacterized protein n=1 Tax=Streptomyces jeddahensis TaxID=1716141 RepID=A0A177HWD6_9ACTN|nr:hypothetical protein [Streptomyces jeddahensis]OAH15175.1 hypothetical protein STSP_13930 [Streptomyces jeddahensis]
MAEHDANLDRLTSGMAMLEAEMAAVRSRREQVMASREQALRVQEALFAAARAGAALRDLQSREETRLTVVRDLDERETVGDAKPSADDADVAAAPVAPQGEDSAAVGAPARPGAATLVAQVLQIIMSEPDRHWTAKLIAVQLEGQGAESDQKAHARARNRLDKLVQKRLLLKRHRDDDRRCHFVAASTTEAA